MKRFTEKLSLILLVTILALSLIGCQTASVETETKAPVVEVVEEKPVKEEPVISSSEVEEVKEEVVIDVAEEVVEEIVTDVVEEVKETASALPYGVKPIVKNTQGDEVFDLFVVHTNDVHGRVDDNIGYSKLSTMLNVARSITNNLLVLDAGDTIHGTNQVNFFEGATAGELMMLLGYDAMAPGNHDFNYGYERLVELARLSDEMGGPKVLAANVLTDDGYNLLQPYQIYTYNDFDVAVIGLSTPDTLVKSHPKNTEGLVFISDEIIQSAQYAIDMAHEIADYVIVLGHIGIDPDGPSGVTADLICENLDGIDLFVDGHSHSELPEGMIVNDTLIVQTGEYLENIGVVQIRVENGEAKGEYPMLITADDVLEPENSALAKSVGIVKVPNDPKIDAYIENINAAVDAVLNEEIANIPYKLRGEREDVRTKQTNLSKMITEAMTAESGADCTIINGGGIRASIEPGIRTKGDINNVLPFTNIITVVEATGKDIIAALEHGYKLLPATNGGYAQTDLSVAYSKFSDPGSRVKRVSLPNGEALQLDKVYKVCTNDFMAVGGDGYSMFGKIVGEGRQLNEVLIDYLKERFPL